MLKKVPPKNETANNIAKHFLGRPSGIRRPPSSQDTYVYNVAYIIDDSGSIGNKSFQQGVTALRMMIDRKGDRSDYAAIKFSTTASVLFPFVLGCQARQKLLNVPYTGGASNTQAALRLARTELFKIPIQVLLQGADAQH